MKKKFWTRRNLILAVIGVIVVGIAGYYFYARKFSMLPEVAVNMMIDVKEPTATDKVLIISPHPDDETIAAGGYVERAIENKAKVEILLVTDGNRRGVGAERHQEFREATKTLGVDSSDLKYLELPEFYLKERVSEGDLTAKLSSEISAFVPTIIIYPDKNDQNPDHKYIGETLDKILADKQNIAAYSYLVHYRYFPQPVGLKMDANLTPPVKLVDFSYRWERFILTNNEEQIKLNALSIYKTQLRTPLLHDLLMSMVRKNELFSAH